MKGAWDDFHRFIIAYRRRCQFCGRQFRVCHCQAVGQTIVRYNITKRKLDHALKEYGSALDEAAAIGSKQPAATDNSLRTARQHGMELVSCYTADLPHWYRLLLESRKESPADASGLLTNLSKIRDRGQLDHRIAEVRNRLGLK